MVIEQRGGAVRRTRSRARLLSSPLRPLSRYAGAASVTGLLVFAACGDDDPAPNAADDPNVVIAEDDDEGKDGVEGSGRGELGAVLLTAADLPDGWSLVPSADTEGTDGSCLDALGASGGPFDLAVAPSVTFAASDLGPFLAAFVVDEPAETALSAVNDILLDCDGSTSPQGFTTTIEPASIDGLPAESAAVRGSDKDGNGSGVNFTIAAAGTEDMTVMVFAVTPLGEIDEAVIAAAINAMYDRIPGS